MVKRRLEHFDQGRGVEQPVITCSECGYQHTSSRNFRRSEDGQGHTCSTGHYVNKAGETKRQANLYAKRR